MRQRSLTLSLLTALALVLSLLTSAPARAADPGEQVISSSGNVPASTTLPGIPIFEANDVNLRLQVGGPPSTSTLIFTVRRGGSSVASWTVRAGETTWGYVSLAAGDQIEIQNPGAASLSYDLDGWARSNLPSIGDGLSDWSGVAAGAGTQSTAQFNVTSPGLYSIALAAASGAFQLKVDENYILKTAAQGVTLDPADSTYYLGPGVHTFRIIQSTAEAQTGWSVTLTSVGGVDALPATESTGALGGGLFTEEWVPLQIAEDQPVNIQITVVGATANSLVVELRNGSDTVFTSAGVFGGEVAWGSSQLVAGANALHITAAGGNSAPLAYTIVVQPITPVPVPWTGTSYGAPAHPTGGNSTIQFTFPTSGLYRFNLGASSGRYQFLLDNDYLQRTVSNASPADFTAFVEAGTYPLVVVQDPAAATTSWSAEITLAEEATDTLPYARAGVTLGGPSNAFGEEWLPIEVAAGEQVNLKLVATGAAADSLRIELYNEDTMVYSATTIYGGEVFWNTSTLATGTNRLRISANAGNSAPMSYSVEVRKIPSTPVSWEGITLGGGISSVVTVDVPISGAYTMVFTATEGAGVVLIDQPKGGQLALDLGKSSTTTIRVPLSAGKHTCTFVQSPGDPRTVWSVSLTPLNQGPWIVNLPLVQN